MVACKCEAEAFALERCQQIRAARPGSVQHQHFGGTPSHQACGSPSHSPMRGHDTHTATHTEVLTAHTPKDAGPLCSFAQLREYTCLCYIPCRSRGVLPPKNYTPQYNLALLRQCASLR
jgi:hypothetical protein